MGQPTISVKQCEHPQCQYIAKVIGAAIDPSVQPCDDFYKFACGKNEGNIPLMSGRFEKKLTKVFRRTSTGKEEKWERNLRYDVILIY